MKHLCLLPLAALLFCSAQLPAARPSYAPPSVDSAEARAVQRLLDPRHRAGRATAELVGELVGVGPRSAPVLVAMLIGALPGTDWESSGLTLEDALGNSASDDVLLTEALRGLPPASVAHALADACAGDAPLDRRLVGLHLLAEAGQGREAVACWHAVASGIEEIHLRRAYVRAQLESALARCLARSASSFESLRKDARTWERRLLPSLLHACVLAERRQGVDVLFDLHDTDRELDLELLGLLPGLAANTVGALDELRVGWFAHFLGDEDPNVRSSAALALGKLCDPGSAERLIDALDDSDARVAQSALWALKHMSGVQLSGSREIWGNWIEEERSWSNEKRAQLVELLAAPEPERVVEGLRELSQHPFYRHASAAAIVAVLSRDDPLLLLAACSAAKELDSLATADALTALLDRPEEGVRNAARSALVALTGQDLPAEALAWQRVLGN